MARQQGRFRISELNNGDNTDLTLQQSMRNNPIPEPEEAKSVYHDEYKQPIPEPTINGSTDYANLNRTNSRQHSEIHSEETIPISVLNHFQDMLSSKVRCI